jgi:ABC-type transport system substrate-binding protein
VDRTRALHEIEAGRADYALDGLPSDAAPLLDARFGPDSKAARAGHQQYFISPAGAARWLHMNTSRPLFSHVRLRRAVNFAIDRPGLVPAGQRFAEINPFNAGEPTADYLPPSTDGAADFHLYPMNRPDLRRARRIAGGPVHATAVMYTPNVPPWLQEAQIIRRDLKPLGIDVRVEAFPVGEFFGRIVRPGEPFDLAVSGWNFGTTDPHPALDIFAGNASRPSGTADFSFLENRAFDRKLKEAEMLSGPRRYRAYRRLAFWLERDVAPAAAFATDASRDFFSTRMGCQVYQPVYGIDLGALCLRG